MTESARIDIFYQTSYAFFFRERKSSSISFFQSACRGAEQRTQLMACPSTFSFAAVSSVPFRSYGVDHIFAGQLPCAGYFCASGPTAVQPSAFFQKLWSCGPVDAAVHAASAQKGAVCGVDYGIHFHFCDIVSDNHKRHGNPPPFFGIIQAAVFYGAAA